MMRLLSAFLIAGTAIAETPPIANESLRIAALAAIFPGTTISMVPGRRIDRTFSVPGLDVPDAFANENVYQVVGKPINEIEVCASDHIALLGPHSELRRLRFRLFDEPRKEGLVAVLQYDFENASPPGACPSIGLVVKLANVGGKWQVLDRFLLEPTHHANIAGVRHLSVDNDRIDAFIVESDFGGGGTVETDLFVFDISERELKELLHITSRIRSYDESYTQTLDATKPQQFCFSKTTTNETNHPCYKLGEGVNKASDETRNKMLHPL